MEFSISTNWNPMLNGFSAERKDAYFTEEYVKLYATHTDEPECFICESDNNILLFPYLRRRFEFGAQSYSDFETPYGYGGPIANTSDKEFIENALRLFAKYCTEQAFVCGFVRFHPLLNNAAGFETIGRVLVDRQTVAINLELSENDIWMNELTSKNRSTIKKAASRGLRFVADYDFAYLDNFIDLYNRTMDKLGADEFYKFGPRYYSTWKSTMPDSFLGVVLSDDSVVSAAMFFYSQDYGHYHLSGSNRDYLSMSPNNLLLWEAALELKRNNVKHFHLGGGSDSDENNSLLDFKSRFAKSRYEFKIGKTIFNQPLYDEICADWQAKNPDKAVLLRNHLLKYKY
ncbi:MAG TPA: GNAT family N-acetyltransferase [Flavobacterium sp.]|jgi:hypothetical protein